jgi:predicted Zn-ribbon and HTH transcriptional regulator
MLDNGFWDFAAFWEFFNPFEEGKTVIIQCPACHEKFNGHNDIEVVDKKRKICKCPKCNIELEYDSDSKCLKVMNNVSALSNQIKQIDKEVMAYIRNKLQPAKTALDLMYQNNDVPKEFLKKAIEDFNEAAGMLTERQWKLVPQIILKCRKCGYTIERNEELDGKDIYCVKCGSFMSEDRLFDGLC